MRALARLGQIRTDSRLCDELPGREQGTTSVELNPTGAALSSLLYYSRL